MRWEFDLKVLPSYSMENGSATAITFVHVHVSCGRTLMSTKIF